jgi:hypothetical protein
VNNERTAAARNSAGRAEVAFVLRFRGERPREYYVCEHCGDTADPHPPSPVQ